MNLLLNPMRGFIINSFYSQVQKSQFLWALPLVHCCLRIKHELSTFVFYVWTNQAAWHRIVSTVIYITLGLVQSCFKPRLNISLGKRWLSAYFLWRQVDSKQEHLKKSGVYIETRKISGRKFFLPKNFFHKSEKQSGKTKKVRNPKAGRPWCGGGGRSRSRSVYTHDHVGFRNNSEGERSRVKYCVDELI